jgi:DNA primase
VRAAVKVTGRRGIHVWIPVARLDYHETRAWTDAVSKADSKPAVSHNDVVYDTRTTSVVRLRHAA